MRIFLLLHIAIWFATKTFAQSGCTDPKATNYNAAAVTNDGSCIYPDTEYSLTPRANLPAVLKESSGLLYADGKMWTFNDSGGAAAIYRINSSTGEVMQTVNITNAANIDWEDMTADATHLYIGDFGNNMSGKRTDLKIYKIKKAEITTDAVVNISAEIIHFSYAVHPIINTHQFDCEAFFYKNNQLHLFTKAWKDSNTYTTSHYTLPASAGTHTAVFQQEFDVNGLITGANISVTNKNEIILVGYSHDLSGLFMWLFFDYPENKFFNGNKRRIGLGSTLNSGQIESVTFTDAGSGYISSEEINQIIAGLPLTVPARLYSFSITDWIPPTNIPAPVDILHFTATYIEPNVELKWQTAAATNIDYFTIEHSVDSVNFTSIGTVQASRNPDTPQNYSFIDVNAAEGSNYYRLKQTDITGKTFYSDIQSVIKDNQEVQLKVYPNPAERGMVMYIQVPQLCCDGVSFLLISPEGKTIFQNIAQPTAAGLISFPTKTLKMGLYLLQITGKDKMLYRKVMIK